MIDDDASARAAGLEGIGGIDSPATCYRYRVRYVDTDQGGIVYHGRYLDYFEWARTDWLRDLGSPYRELEAAGHGIVVVEAALRYRSPARYDDEIDVALGVEGFDGARCELAYAITDATSAELRCTGRTTLASISMETGRPRRWTETLRAGFSAASIPHDRESSDP